MDKAEEFYSRNADRYADQYRDENLVEDFLDDRDRFVELLSGNAKVLDAGCGPGRDTEYFVEQGLDAVGIDAATGMIEYAKKNRQGEYHEMDMRDLSFEDGEFDGIWAPSSIFFMPEDQMKESLEEFRRVLDDDGLLFVGFKNGDGEIVKEKWDGEVKQYHLSRSEAVELIEDSGYEIIETGANESHTGSSFMNFYCQID